MYLRVKDNLRFEISVCSGELAFQGAITLYRAYTAGVGLSLVSAF
jgi:hypothetical protein